MVVLRINIAKSELKKDKDLKREYSCYKKTGIILLPINLFITIIVLLIVNSAVSLQPYNQIIAITVAAFTFYLMVNSIRSLIKYRKYKSPLMSAAKTIGVVSGLISMLSLEIIMLSTFSPAQTEFNKVMIMSAGGGICIIIMSISLYMIVKAGQINKKL